MQEKIDLNKTENLLKHMAKKNTMMVTEEEEIKPQRKITEIKTDTELQLEALKEELAEIKEMLAHIITNKTIVNEGDGSTVDLLIAGTHFRGKMNRVVK